MQEENYTVYRHIAPNGKMYVGITSQKPEKRGKENIIKGYRWKYYDDYIKDKERRSAI